jgi:hypothetical protein
MISKVEEVEFMIRAIEIPVTNQIAKDAEEIEREERNKGKMIDTYA